MTFIPIKYSIFDPLWYATTLYCTIFLKTTFWPRKVI